ncbi:glutaminyl-peptide cyclotransferase [Zunongwangia sp. HRR-M8]|uniref:glutaminyl-peptide cyclotransferase n=1 Tax=Zunongwangia sp. HRR-M8 TaxID=3015170 RepID=UPI0022DDAF63|nr:glutaminyl-peptide cyclotransferase [Zunongwangia sp. HRR-M8]WBL21388.1 glutaminyl-peptide cyclotransferase [Zunongwangia sp. HRR-M8]
MMKFKSLLILTLAFLYFSCGSNSGSKNSSFKIKIEGNKKEFKLGERISGQIENKKEFKIDSVVVHLNTEKATAKSPNWSFNFSLEDEKLGNQTLEAEVFYEGKKDTTTKSIKIYNNAAPKAYTYEIVNTYPHDPEAYTQGLEFLNDTLYESTGEYGESDLRKVDLKTGKVLEIIKLDDSVFGEGMTIFKNQIILLTWRAKEGYIYNLNTFEKTGTFSYNQSKEGWGLCHDGEHIYKSDGTEKIWLLNPETLAEEDYIQIATHKNIVSKMNELEWVDGEIYANTYQKDGVAIINPKNGAIDGLIDFRGLRDKLGNKNELDEANHVLNGIAYNPHTKQLFVTGKHWDKLFEVKIIEK